MPIPGATSAALRGAILAQAPLIYKPMTQELAAVYSCSPDQVTSQIQTQAVLIGAGADLAIEMATEFLKEIASELGEAAVGLGISAIPFLGALLAAGLDATVAATLTWRVGTMVSAYFQNGESWIGSRKHTYHIAKDMVGGLSPQTENRANLNNIGNVEPGVGEKQLSFVLNLIEMLRTITNNRDQIRSALIERKVPSWLIERALQRAFAT